VDRETIQARFGIIGESPAIRHVVDQVRLVARTDANVLIEGESGVGKEVIARTIHQLSSRKHNRLVVVNCGAIPEGLIESELFGNEKGAYTGAVERRIGYFEEADKGTIFLDEIGEMPLAAQVRLLRVLETGEYSRVGSSAVRKSDVRVVAATNKVLATEVRNNRFREDLYYRLSTVVIDIPPIRERREDILPLFEKFLFDLSQEYNSPGRRLDDSARGLLVRYRWPGNVRELRNVAERVVVLHRGETLSDTDIRPYLRGVSTSSDPGGLVLTAPDESEPSTTRERELIYRALLELRQEIRELKRQLAGATTRQSTRPDDRRFVYFENEEGRDVIEEAPFEIAEDDLVRRALPAGPTRHAGDISVDGQAAVEGQAATDGATNGEPLPTLEDAERGLIAEALRRFDGNRRQTARALGISERTLYRKIREMEEEDVSEA
jgi:DNA-binding NtrC family response regulator